MGVKMEGVGREMTQAMKVVIRESAMPVLVGRLIKAVAEETGSPQGAMRQIAQAIDDGFLTAPSRENGWTVAATPSALAFALHGESGK